MKKKLLFLRPQILFCIIILSCFCFQSCKSNTDEDEAKKNVTAPIAASGISCFKLDSSKVNKYLLKSTQGFEEIILQLTLVNLLATDGKIGVISYFAENHSEHATGKDSIGLQEILGTPCLVFKKDQTYIIGNNYILVDNIRAVLNGNEKIYTYLKFIPVMSKKGKALKHIAFQIKAFDKNDNELTPLKALTAGTDISNPSPPAKPDEL